MSYRRDDASGFAGRLHHSLEERLGFGRVFRDIDSIGPGRDFVSQIDASVRASGALVIVIGKEWLDARAADGTRRLDDEDDFVRREVVQALAEGLLIVPALVEGAAMPSTDLLPPAMAELARHNAVELTDSRWEFDVGRLVAALEKGLPPASRWSALVRSARARPARVGTALAVLVALTAAAMWTTVVRGSSSVMSGGLNLAVAEFGAVDEHDRTVASPEAKALSQSVYEQLRQSLSPEATGGVKVQLRGPNSEGAIRGATPEDRASAAAARARKIKADLVVYGTVRVGGGTELQPEFFLGQRPLVGSEELAGQHQLGGAVQVQGDIARSPVAAALLRDEVVGRAAAFAHLVVGLGYYAEDQLMSARDHLQQAEDAPGWKDGEGKEVVHLFVGSAALKDEDLVTAGLEYERALALNPEYARARLGIAEVQFQMARHECEPGVADGAGMAAALASFNRAASAGVQPPISRVPIRAVFGKARVHACETVAGVEDHSAVAQGEYREVLAAYREAGEPLRELAAESHAGLGFLALPAVGAPDADDRYRTALREYQQAFELTHRADRQVFFKGTEGFLHGRLHELDQADAAYALAIKLEHDDGRRQLLISARSALHGNP